MTRSQKIKIGARVVDLLSPMTNKPDSVIPYAALHEAIAQLVWLSELDSSAMPPEERRILTQSVLGFCKYVFDELLPNEYSPASD